MRLIDADALIEEIDGDLTDSIAEGRAIEKIMNAPTIEPKKGKWLDECMDYGECSECGFYGLTTDYCPNCGADMRGEQE